MTKTNVSAACANFFHLQSIGVNTTKRNILKSTDVRLETHADYHENNFDQEFRLKKKRRQKTLEEMLFSKRKKK